jgi:hypothetical protein
MQWLQSRGYIPRQRLPICCHSRRRRFQQPTWISGDILHVLQLRAAQERPSATMAAEEGRGGDEEEKHLGKFKGLRQGGLLPFRISSSL